MPFHSLLGGSSEVNEFGAAFPNAGELSAFERAPLLGGCSNGEKSQPASIPLGVLLPALPNAALQQVTEPIADHAPRGLARLRFALRRLFGTKTVKVLNVHQKVVGEDQRHRPITQMIVDEKIYKVDPEGHVKKVFDGELASYPSVGSRHGAAGLRDGKRLHPQFCATTSKNLLHHKAQPNFHSTGFVLAASSIGILLIALVLFYAIRSVRRSSEDRAKLLPQANSALVSSSSVSALSNTV